MLLIGSIKFSSHAAQPIRSTTQIWVVTRHQYGISALVSQTSFGGKTSGSVAKCRLFSQASLPPVLQKKTCLGRVNPSKRLYEEKLTPLPKPTSLSARFDCQNSTCVCSDCLALTKVDPARQAKVFISEPPQDFKAKDIQKHAHNMLPLHAKCV